MDLKKKHRSNRAGKQRLSYLPAYNQGHIDGFRRGREDGFTRGHADALKMFESNVIALQRQPPMDALVITAGIIPSLEIGVSQPFSSLKTSENFQFEIKLEHEVSKEMIAAAKTIVFVRNVEPGAYALFEWAKLLGKRTVYVIDDNFLEIQPTTPVGQYYADPARQETFIKFLRNAQIVKVDAQDLGVYIKERFNQNVVYFPASVDFDWLDRQEKRQQTNEQVVIGYEGGEKEQDFAPVIPALNKILAYYGGFVRLEFFGYVPASLAEHPSVNYEEGGMEYRDFIIKLNQSNWDIGLAPLDDNVFNKGKTNNKFREYGACRIPGIYSKSPVYTSWVTHGETGFLVPHTTDGWFEGIKEMIERPELRQQIKENAEIAARQHFSLHKCVENWKNYVFMA